MERKEKVILAYKLHAKATDPNMGFVKALAEYIDGKYVALDEYNFCPSGRVFITSYYEEIDKKFNDYEIFRISAHETDRGGECLYVSQGIRVIRLQPKEMIHILEAPLPDVNDKRFSSSIIPSTRYIIIKDGDMCYGSFEWSPKDNKDDGVFSIGFMTTPLSSTKLEPGQIFKKSFGKFKDGVLNINGLLLLPNFVDFTNGADDYPDYASDDEVISYCARLASTLTTQDKIKQLDTLAQQIKNKNNTRLVKERLTRLTTEIVPKQENLNEEMRLGIERFLRTKHGEKLLEDYVHSSRSKIVERIKKEEEKKIDDLLEVKRNDLELILLKLKDKEEESKNISIEIGRKREEARQDVLLDEAHRKADAELSAKKNQLEKLERTYREIQEKYEALQTLESIKQEIKDEDRYYERMRSLKRKIEDEISSLDEKYRSTEDKLREKLLDIKPYVDTINGAFSSRKIEIPVVSVTISDISNAPKLLDKQLNVVNALYENFCKNDRPIPKIDIINLVVSTQQSFICFLAGLPGVGKTSLSRIFVQSQGLEKRFKEVSVARGWTSQKDLIGFFNPLTNRFQSSNTDLYSFLLALQQGKFEDQAMAYVLLDEANLSPIEHYWSIFMGKTDTLADYNRQSLEELSLGGAEKLIIPKYLRFIATINYDSTTEPLSPRIVDRAPIIVLDGEMTNIKDLKKEIVQALPISASNLDVLFGNDSEAEFELEEKEIFEAIKQILQDPNPTDGKPLHISPRKEVAIKQYCYRARSLMSVLSEDNDDLTALDFAILQHILPQVRGNGRKFSERLNKLKKKLIEKELRRSAARLEKMINFGASELDTYDFFCW